jgi:pyridoxine 5-phosphate synthase
VTRCARLCVEAGAEGITVHPRPDQRHIRPLDVTELAGMLAVEFNIEGNPFAGAEGTYPGFMEIVRAARPVQATLVPDDPGQLTSDHGWDLTEANRRRLKPLIDDLKRQGVRVSLFMDAEAKRMRGAAELGADRVELYTEPYARAFAAGRQKESLPLFAGAAKAAQDLGLGVNAGHDLSLANLRAFVEDVPAVLEVSIGHALIAEALEIGLAETVRAYVKILSGGTGR